MLFWENVHFEIVSTRKAASPNVSFGICRRPPENIKMQQLSCQNWYEVEKSVENWFLSKNWTNIILNKIYSIFLSSRNNWGRWSTYQSLRSLSRLISSLWTAGTHSSTKSKQVSSKQNSFMVSFRSTQFFSPTSIKKNALIVLMKNSGWVEDIWVEHPFQVSRLSATGSTAQCTAQHSNRGSFGRGSLVQPPNLPILSLLTRSGRGANHPKTISLQMHHFGSITIGRLGGSTLDVNFGRCRRWLFLPL